MQYQTVAFSKIVVVHIKNKPTNRIKFLLEATILLGAIYLVIPLENLVHLLSRRASYNSHPLALIPEYYFSFCRFFVGKKAMFDSDFKLGW